MKLPESKPLSTERTSNRKSALVYGEDTNETVWLGRRGQSADARVSRSRMGCAGARRSQAFRIPRARSGAGRAQLVDRAQQARGVSTRVQSIRSAESGAIHERPSCETHREPGDRSKPLENRSRRA